MKKFLLSILFFSFTAQLAALTVVDASGNRIAIDTLPNNLTAARTLKNVFKDHEISEYLSSWGV